MKVLVTGAAGFIGHHVARRLAETRRCEVLGVDNLSDYYDVALKRARLEQLAPLEDFRFLQADFADAAKFPALVAHFKPDYVVHLGAQPGVRFSMEQPAAYTRNNLEGFATVLEACRRNPPRHLVFASSSSVYGAGAKPPFREDDDANRPVSYYGATKRANELMAYSYAHNHRLNVTGLRFFTVYGPWGRPDMAPHKFTSRILEGRPIDVYNHGQMRRDFTYVTDLVQGILGLIDSVPLRPATRAEIAEGDSLSPAAPYRVVNIGNSDKVRLLDFIEALETSSGKTALRNYMDMQPGDVPATWADASLLHRLTGYRPNTPVTEGVARFIAWYEEYYRP